jgi:hypothetical protein
MLDANDIRRLNLDQLKNETSEARRRAGLKKALEIGYDASDQLHTVPAPAALEICFIQLPQRFQS